MRAAECYEVIARRWSDQVVVCSLGITSHEWWKQTRSDRAFYMTSSMGLAASFGLGIGLCLPQADVWVLDSDGALVMNLGTLLTEAHCQPPNVVHFVLDNGCYQTIGGHPLVNQKRTDFAAIARAAGIERTYAFFDTASLDEELDGILETREYAFVVLDVEEQEGGSSLQMPFEGPEMKYRFGRSLERQFGHQVFGPLGY